MKIVTHPRCVEYEYPGHPERPARIARTVDRLKRQRVLRIEWLDPLSVEDPVLLRAHDRSLLDRLEHAEDFDMDTPAHPNLPDHARRSVGGALRALACGQAKEPVFSLFRPPGHHATSNRAMGFCYLNNVAVATLAAQASGVGRVAVVDFDVHHGNGTEEILLDRPDVRFFSIHQFPAYPGTGRRNRGGNCFNYTVPPGCSRPDYRDTAERMLGDLAKFRPELIAVSAGFDAYAGDPLCQQRLEHEDFHWYGTVLRQLGVPMFSLLEGGYSDALPDLILAYLGGLEGVPMGAIAGEAAAKT